MSEITEIAVGIGAPIAPTLGPIGLIIVLVVVRVLCGLIFLLKYSIDHIKEMNSSHQLDRIELKKDSDKRDERAQKNIENNTKSMETLTTVLLNSNNYKR